MKTTGLDGPIVMGLDDTDQSARAAALGGAIAESLGVETHYVHAIRDRWADVRQLALAAAATVSATAAPTRGRGHQLTAQETEDIRDTLSHRLPDGTLDTLAIEVGRAPSVLAHFAERVAASMIVLGGKHHAALSRWTVGSTANDLVRTSETPVLIVGDAPATISRVLVAVDLSSAAPHVLRFAEHLAARLEAAILGLHVVNDSVPTDEGYGLSKADLIAAATSLADERLWSTMTHPRAEHIIRKGKAGERIRQEIIDWDADLVVVGSHGQGWDGRMLLGGTTEGLVNDLPASILVYPIT